MMVKYISVKRLIRNLDGEREELCVTNLLKQGLKEKAIPKSYIRVYKNHSIGIKLNCAPKVKTYLEERGFNIHKGLVVKEEFLKKLKKYKDIEEKEAKELEAKKRAEVEAYNLKDSNILLSPQERQRLIEDLEAKVNSNPTQRYTPSQIVHNLKIPLKFMQNQISVLGEYNLSLGGYLGKRVLELAQKFEEIQNPAPNTCSIYKPN